MLFQLALKLYLLGNSLVAGITVLMLFCIAGWPLSWAAALAASVAFFSFRRQKIYLRLMVARMDKGAADVKKRQCLMAEKAARVTWSAIAGGILCYAIGCQLFHADSFVAQILRSRSSLAPMVAPEVDSRWSLSSGPWWEKYPPERPGLLGTCRYVLAGVGAYAAGKLLRKMLVPPQGQRPGPRGRTVLTNEEAMRIARKHLRPGDQGLSWGGVRVAWHTATGHWSVAGATGSGKTMLQRLLMQSSLPYVGRGLDQRGLVYDAKQDMVSCLWGMGLCCEIHILNAFDLRCTAWRIAADCDSPVLAMQIAFILIPEEKGEHRFFVDASRDLLRAVLISLIRTCPGGWDLRDVVLAMQNGRAIRSLIERLPETAAMVQYFEVPVTLQGILSTIATKMAPFGAIAAAWSHARRQISIRDWTRSEAILVLGNDSRIKQATIALNRVLLHRMSDLLLAQSDSEVRRTWVFFDEIREAGNLPGFSSLLTLGRSQGLSVCMGFQDIEGLREVYGERVANEIVGQTHHKALLGLQSPETARWASNVIGECEKYEYHTSRTSSQQGASYTVNEHLVKREAVLPAEFMNLPRTSRANGLTGYFISPDIGVYRATIPGSTLEKELKSRDASVADFLPRPAEHEYLRPWSEEDCRRLLLDPSLAGHGGGDRRPVNPRIDVPRIVRPSP